MSLKTHRAWPLLLLALLPLTGFGDENEDTRGDVNRAMNDFYKAVKASPDRSAAKQEKLSEQIIEPANAKATQEARKKAQADATRLIQQAAGAGASLPANLGKMPEGNTSQGRVEVSEPIMDAKDIPAEIEFPGHRPTPAPSAKTR